MTDPLGALRRYRPVIEDFDDFIDWNLRPEPLNLRVRTALVSPEELDRALAARGFELEEVPGLPTLRKVVRAPHSPALTLEHWLGLFHVQQAVMAVPSLALGARPGERVLDLCAAPGGKTTHLAELMEDRGCLVAVDPKEKRLRGLMSNVFRMGHTNVLVVASDGRDLSTGALFDRVLVDAPCSAEGNFRRTGGRLPRRDGRFLRYVTALQEALLRRGIELVRPGGTIVYSTCTWAPEENEAILARVLADAPVAVEAIDLPLPHAPGITEWNGRSYPDQVRDAWRLYPRHLDSGGAFVARLRRLDEGAGDSPGDRGARGGADGADDGWTPVPDMFPGEDPEPARVRIRKVEALLRDRFGVAEAELARLGWMTRAENLWVHTSGEWPVEGWRSADGNERASGRWRVVSHGLRAFRGETDGREHPSSAFLTRFAGLLRSGVIEPDDAELRRMLDGEPVAVTADPASPSGPGPVAVRWGGANGHIVGRAMVRADGRCDLQVPKARAAGLRELLPADQSAD